MEENKGGILSPEDVERLQATERKRAQRDRDKAKEAAATKLAKAKAALETPHTYWQRNRDVMNKARLAELVERQDTVLNHLADMQMVMEGKAPNGSTLEEWTTDVVEGVAQDVAEFRYSQPEIILLEFWKSPTMIAELMATLSEPTSIFLRYGLFVAIPDNKINQFKRFNLQNMEKGK